MNTGKLGKLSPRLDSRTLKFASYLVDLPPPPDVLDLVSDIGPWGMMMNNSLGCCTISASGHAIMSWTAAARGKPAIPADQDIVAAYSAVSGYDPRSGENDNGAVELDVLKYWRSNGIAGHRIAAFAAIDLSHPRHVMQAAYLFGGVYIGVSLPRSAQAQGDLWSLSGSPTDDDLPGSWGGHAIWVPALYDTQHLGAITWGSVQKISWAWWRAYCDEAYAIISQDFLTGERKTPQGFDLAALQADLRALAS